MSQDIEIQICSTCRVEKPATEYHKNKNRKNGLKIICKTCSKIAIKKWKSANKDWVARYDSHYCKTHREEINLTKKAAYYKNPEKYRKLSRDNYANNTEKFLASNKMWFEKNPEKSIWYKLKWARNNPEYFSKKRADKINATPSWSNHKYIKLFYRLARIEEKRTGKKVQVDHMVPLNSPLVCGLHVEHNLQLLFATDNGSKGNRQWPDMW